MMNNFQSKKEEFKQCLESKVLKSIYPPPEMHVIKIPSRRPIKPPSQHAEKIISNECKQVSKAPEDYVNAADGRKQVLMTDEWPHSVHGVVACNFKNFVRFGTGTLIGPNIVLTAGHNLYSHEYKTYASLEMMQFLPGINGQMLPFSFVGVEEYFVSPIFLTEEKEDYGLLILKEPIGYTTGYFGLACLEPEELKNKRINVTGYPADKVESKPNTYEMWEMEGEASSINQNKGLISYLIDANQGQEGSGVWFQDGDDYYVCGVHILSTRLVNKATLLTRAMYRQIYSWISQTSQKKFLQFGEKFKFTGWPINTECLSLLQEYDLTQLRVLTLSSTKIGSREAKVLAQITSWISLSKLNLSENNIDAEGVKALAQNTSWINLSRLYLSHNNIGDEGAKALAQNTSWLKLFRLALSRNNIGDEGAKALAQNTSWIELSELDLSHNNIGDEGAKALAQNTSWINLSRLYLSHNYIGDEGAKALAQNTSWIKLSQLNLSHNHIGDQGAKALAQNSSWLKVFKLYLSHNYIGNEGAKALAQNTSWIKLSQLNLSHNHIGDQGTIALAQNTSWIKLSQLNLSHNYIGDEGAQVLAQNTYWSDLRSLDLSNNQINAVHAQAIKEEAPWIDLSSNLPENEAPRIDLSSNLPESGIIATIKKGFKSLKKLFGYQ